MPDIGRPRIDVDWTQVDALLKIQCTGEEIASFLNVSYDTLERRCREDREISFADYSRLKREGGKPALRRAQWKLAVEGLNATMLIWLGKQMLGQRDKTDMAILGKIVVESPTDKLTRYVNDIAAKQRGDTGDPASGRTH